MSFITNTFLLTATNNTLSSYTINGLTSATSTTTITNINLEVSLLFCKAIYKTLLDAGYEATIDQNSFKITVLGFSFFALSKSYTSTASKFDARLAIYLYGSEAPLVYASNTEYNNGNGGFDLKFALTLRGDENGFVLTGKQYKYYNTTQDVPLIYILKGKNLIDSSDSWLYGEYIEENSDVLLKDKYANIGSLTSSHTNITYNLTGFNTNSIMAYIPVFAYYDTIYIPSLISACDEIIVRGSYYQIGNEIFWAASYKQSSTSTTYSGGYVLIRIS